MIIKRQNKRLTNRQTERDEQFLDIRVKHPYTLEQKVVQRKKENDRLGQKVKKDH